MLWELLRVKIYEYFIFRKTTTVAPPLLLETCSLLNFVLPLQYFQVVFPSGISGKACPLSAVSLLCAQGWGHCWSMEARSPPGPVLWGSSGWPAAALLVGGRMSPPEATSWPHGHTSHCPFALTVPFPAAERLVPTPFPLLGARSEGGREPRGHPSSHLSIPRDPEPSSAATGTRAFFPRGLPAKMLGQPPATRPGVCGPHPRRWARRVRDPLETLFLGP